MPIAVPAPESASQANIGRISMVRAAWNAAFIEELASFPRGAHDDQVDALSLAFSKLERNTLAQWLRLWTETIAITQHLAASLARSSRQEAWKTRKWGDTNGGQLSCKVVDNT
jgi:hypothetical protein